MKKRFTIILILAVVTIQTFIVACTHFSDNSYSRKFQLNPIQEIEIRAGFNVQSGSIFLNSDKEYLMISDFQTHKKIVFFELESQEVDLEVQLDSVWHYGGNIESVDVINLDSILVLTQYSNHLYCINRKGEIWKKIDLNLSLRRTGYFELTAGWNPFLVNSNTLLFKANYSIKNDAINQYQDKLFKFQKDANNSPYFFKVENLFEDEFTGSFGADSFYSYFIDTNDIAVEGGRYITNEEHVFLSSIFVDTVYQYDQKTLRIINKHKIQSDYTSIGYKPGIVDQFYKNNQYHNDLGQTKGSISKMMYDLSLGLYYFVVVHTIPIDTPREKRIRPWSILIYDKNLNKLDELKVDEKKYSPYIIPTKNGLLISNYPTKKNEKDIFKKTTFQHFEIVEL